MSDSDEIYRENQSPNVMFRIFSPEYRAVNQIMWEHFVQPHRPQIHNIMRRIKDAVCMPDNEGKNTDCLILIAFPWQQWLRERASTLRYTYIACLVFMLCVLPLFSFTFNLSILKTMD